MIRYTLVFCALLLAFMAGAMWAVDDGVDLQCYESEARPILQVP